MNEIPNALARKYPVATPEPCNECPWRRVSVSGHLGPYLPADWIKIVHGEAPIACHKTVVTIDPLEGTGTWDHPKIRQCRGAAIFRANVGKLPKNPTIATGPPEPADCFDSNEEFLAHHGADPMRAIDLYAPLSVSRHEEGSD